MLNITCTLVKKVMKKPLLTAKEQELLNEFPADNLSLLPKLLNIDISVSGGDDLSESVEDPTKMRAELREKRVLNMDPATSRPIYYYDFAVNEAEGENGCLRYKPGDSFGFYPKLSDEEVKFLAEKLQTTSLDDLIKISASPESLSSFFPGKKIEQGSVVVKMGELLGRLDVRGLPKKAVLRTLAEYCQDERDSAVLLFLSSRKGSDAFNRLRTEFLSVQTLLAALDSLKPTLEVLASVVGPLQPRFYSSCRQQVDSSFQIVFNVNESVLASEFKIRGVCSSWLASSLEIGHSVPILQRSISHFRLPDPLKSDQPIIMIAAGTGVAPFIGFLETLQCQSEKPFSWLIFGFRNFQDDFIFANELESFKVNGILSRLSLAVSRDPVEPKMYVQDVIRKEKAEFSKILQDALIYVCGDELTMIKGVNEAITELILENNPQMNLKEAETLMSQWTKEKKIIRDIWV